MGTVNVPADRYWGAQTQRSLQHFSIGNDKMPKEVYHAYGYVKKAAALVNAKAGRLEQWRADAIIQAAEETIAGKLDDNFPLYVWQTGSGIIGHGLLLAMDNDWFARPTRRKIVVSCHFRRLPT